MRFLSEEERIERRKHVAEAGLKRWLLIDKLSHNPHHIRAKWLWFAGIDRRRMATDPTRREWWRRQWHSDMKIARTGRLHG